MNPYAKTLYNTPPQHARHNMRKGKGDGNNRNRTDHNVAGTKDEKNIKYRDPAEGSRHLNKKKKEVRIVPTGRDL